MGSFFFPPPPAQTGGMQPYQGLSFLQGGLRTDNPPFTGRGQLQDQFVVHFQQPSSWLYAFMGRQPYEPKAVFTPGIPVNDPPFSARGRTPDQTVVFFMQPDPWLRSPLGGHQPYEGRKFFEPGRSVDQPPFSGRGQQPDQLVVSWMQPDPWMRGAMGGRQPYEPRRLPPSITAVRVDQPPNVGVSRQNMISVLRQWEPLTTYPFTYALRTTSIDPILPRQLSYVIVII